MLYTKPQILEAGMSEGVYTASGNNLCDCFYIEMVTENPTAAFGGYWLEFNIHRNAEHTHVVPEDWANLYAKITFNKDISGFTVRGGNTSVSGSVLTLEMASIVPADAGDWSYHGIQIVGTGSAELKCESIEVKHH